MARVFEITLWVVVVGALVWLAAALVWHLRPHAARRAAASVLVPALEKLRLLLGGGSFDVLKTATPISLDDLAGAILDRLRAELLDVPAVGPQQGLISWNIPKTLPAGSWRTVQVRVSRGSMNTADHRAGLEGGPPAYTQAITVGSRIAVRLHSDDPGLQIDDRQADEHAALRARDLPDQRPRHWNFRIRSDGAGWRELSLIATALKPVLEDPFERRHQLEFTRTRLAAWRRSLPKHIKWAASTALLGIAGIVGSIVADVAKPHLQAQACSVAEWIRLPCEQPATPHGRSDAGRE